MCSAFWKIILWFLLCWRDKWVFLFIFNYFIQLYRVMKKRCQTYHHQHEQKQLWQYLACSISLRGSNLVNELNLDVLSQGTLGASFCPVKTYYHAINKWIQIRWSNSDPLTADVRRCIKAIIYFHDFLLRNTKDVVQNNVLNLGRVPHTILSSDEDNVSFYGATLFFA